MARRSVTPSKADAVAALGIRALNQKVYDPLNPPDVQIWREYLRRNLTCGIPMYHAASAEIAFNQLAAIGERPQASEEDREIGERARKLRNSIREAIWKQQIEADPIDKIVRMALRRSR